MRRKTSRKKRDRRKRHKERTMILRRDVRRETNKIKIQTCKKIAGKIRMRKKEEITNERRDEDTQESNKEKSGGVYDTSS